MNGYLTQPTLFGSPIVEGFGSDALLVRKIPKTQADAIIVAGHYSRSVVWNSSVHLGVFAGGECVGALQFGAGMNPASGGAVVEGTEPGQWLELNRMWLADSAPRHAATQAISGAVKVLRRIRPEVAWIQSFADERCGKLGAVYQAASFLYLGSHEQTFYLLDGEWFHKSMKGRALVDRRGWGCGPKVRRFKAGEHRAVPHTFRQYRYLRPLRPWVRRALRLSVQPYPKPEPQREVGL